MSFPIQCSGFPSTSLNRKHPLFADLSKSSLNYELYYGYLTDSSDNVASVLGVFTYCESPVVMTNPIGRLREIYGYK